MELPLALERPLGSCGPCIVHWQEILSPSYYPPERPLALERPQGYWNGRLRPLYCSLAGDIISVLFPSWTGLWLMERPQGYWNRPQGSCGPCIAHWQHGIAPYIISVL